MTAAFDTANTADAGAGSVPPSTPAIMLTAVGGGGVVVGGLVAAVTGPLEIARGSWLAAYLVLVGGVAQYVMGRTRIRYPGVPRSRDWTQFSAWNLGNISVIGGTLWGEPAAVDLGAVALIVALVIALLGTRSALPRVRLPRLTHWAYRAVLVVLAVSIPIGIVLSHLRHG